VRWGSFALTALVALTLAIGVLGLPPHDTPAAPVHDHVGRRYIEHAVAETGMPNLVTAVLLDYRGFDTFVEVTVIFAALVAVLALPRGGRPGAEASSGEDTVAVSPIVSFVVRWLAPFIGLFALATLFRGHTSPGGGFQAAAVFGALFVALGLVLGRARVAQLVPEGARAWLQAAAPLGFALIAVLGWWLTGSFLGFPREHDLHAVREAMGVALEVAIAVGGGVVLARLFLALEA
jgi:multicomponent Na+:H+ antiporter subunit B